MLLVAKDSGQGYYLDSIVFGIKMYTQGFMLVTYECIENKVDIKHKLNLSLHFPLIAKAQWWSIWLIAQDQVLP